MFPFYTPQKHQKSKGFLVSSGDTKWKHSLEMVNNAPILNDYLHFNFKSRLSLDLDY